MPCGARGLQKSARKIWIANDLEVKYREQMTYDRYRPGGLYRLRLDHDGLTLGWEARLDVTGGCGYPDLPPGSAGTARALAHADMPGFLGRSRGPKACSCLSSGPWRESRREFSFAARAP